MAGRPKGAFGPQRGRWMADVFDELEREGKLSKRELALLAWDLAKTGDPRGIEIVCDRWFGRPPQGVVHEGEIGISNIVQVPTLLEDSAWEDKAQKRLIPN